MMGIGAGKLPGVMKHDFSQVPQAEIQRSVFNRSHGYKTTFDAGYLVPIFVDEALPGDTFKVNMTTFARMTTPIKPFMDNLYCDVHFFAVPIRLVWDDFKKFMGEQVDPGDSTSYTVPQMDAPAVTGIQVGELGDYFGLPTDIPSITFNSLHFRAYNLIWNEWYRDQNLQDSVVVDKDAGKDTYSDYVLLKRGKRHDYFTSCLPWPQKGTAVTLPLGTDAPVLGIGDGSQAYPLGPINPVESDGTSSTYTIARAFDANFFVEGQVIGGANYPHIRADLSAATAATINALRQAFQIQRLYERDARGGTRYTEIVRSHFGVVSPDARLQRPEYLGGGSSMITVAPIPQTATSATTPLGNLAAIATHAANNQGFAKSFTEHTLLLGLCSVRADLNYQQGMNRMWSRQTRWDFYWPALSHIGEQAVLNKEIYCDGSSDDEEPFGYQERYAEYRYKPSLITGLFRSTAAGTLEIWHAAQEFGSLPVLDDTFIQENPPIDRLIAVPAEPHFLLDAYFDMKCARPMPTYSVPGLIDHF